ncbi:MAG: hypothetical protein KAT05_14840, partial [Spirochaetes bacterium]|nr:hypothetical protein [Spirochaetota bacterium]
GEVISIDLSSYIYVSGSFSGSVDFNPHITAHDIKTANNDFDQFLTKYSYNGGYVHTKTFDGTGSIQINDIKFDNNNNMILIGNFNGNIDFDTGANSDNIESLDNKDAFITKYNYQ